MDYLLNWGGSVQKNVRASIGPVFTFGARGVSEAAAGQTAAEASRSSISVPLLGVATAMRGGKEGVEIVEVAPGSAAELANLHVGYVITSVDEKPVNAPIELAAALQNRAPGSQVRLGYMLHSSALGYFPKETVIILAGTK